MTKEAEENLGMPNSLTGLPPLKSVRSAAEVQKAQEAEIERLHNHNSSKETKDNALDVFYPADLHWQVLIALGLGTNALLAYASDEFLRENCFECVQVDIEYYIVWRGINVKAS
ncbi:hypothetical protein G6F35_007070 [Rhizopus arrhizus]|nr:hypothetical protein G6F35_007070 [Rhizopus arrhizus]